MSHATIASEELPEKPEGYVAQTDWRAYITTVSGLRGNLGQSTYALVYKEASLNYHFTLQPEFSDEKKMEITQPHITLDGTDGEVAYYDDRYPLSASASWKNANPVNAQRFNAAGINNYQQLIKDFVDKLEERKRLWKISRGYDALIKHYVQRFPPKRVIESWANAAINRTDLIVRATLSDGVNVVAPRDSPESIFFLGEIKKSIESELSGKGGVTPDFLDDTYCVISDGSSMVGFARRSNLKDKPKAYKKDSADWRVVNDFLGARAAAKAAKPTAKEEKQEVKEAKQEFADAVRAEAAASAAQGAGVPKLD